MCIIGFFMKIVSGTLMPIIRNVVVVLYLMYFNALSIVLTKSIYLSILNTLNPLFLLVKCILNTIYSK